MKKGFKLTEESIRFFLPASLLLTAIEPFINRLSLLITSFDGANGNSQPFSIAISFQKVVDKEERLTTKDAGREGICEVIRTKNTGVEGVWFVLGKVTFDKN